MVCDWLAGVWSEKGGFYGLPLQRLGLTRNTRKYSNSVRTQAVKAPAKRLDCVTNQNNSYLL